MDLFSGVVPFICVAEERSYRKASARLGVSTAAVSRSVTKLEESLGVTLLHRTTRAVSLTAEGALFLDQARQAVRALEEARDSVGRAVSAPQGTLRVSMPLILGRLFVREIARFGARHPRLSLDVSFTDRYSRLVEEHIDVAIRVGALEPSSFVARRLRTPRWVTVASPTYLARAGTPRVAADLAPHRCLKFVPPQGGVRAWTFRDGPPPEGADGQAVALFDHGELLVDAALEGMGITQVLDFMVGAHLSSGGLVEVLAEQSAAGPPMHAIYLRQRQASPKVRAFLELVERVLGRAARDLGP